MKKIIYSILIVGLVCLLNSLKAQNTAERCATDELMQTKLEDPQFATEYQTLQEEVAEKLAKNKGQAPCVNPLIVPVAVHFESGNISSQCMIDATLAQIDQINADFASCNANAGLLCEWINAGCDNFGGSAGADAMPDDGACIQFCLADRNLPTGETTIGGYAITAGDYNSNNQNASNNWQGYFNVYVGAAGGYLGFVPFLSGASNTNNTQGASVLTSTWGAASFSGCEGVGTDNTFGNGATFTHEAGHWFGLDHTFSDNLQDTPPQNSPNYGCPTVNTNNCTSSAGSDYGGNFMDYIDDDCMFIFTQDQVDLMIATAAAQNQWAINSVSCALTYPPCTDQAGACDAAACASVDLEIIFDGAPAQTSWDITDASGTVVASGGNYGTQPGNNILNLSPACLPDGCYDLNFYDGLSNGMCPFISSTAGLATFITPGTLISPGTIVGTLSLIVTPGLCGNYTLTDANGGTLVSGGGPFGAQESTQFCLVGGVAPRLASPQNNSKTINDYVFEIKPSITSNFITVNYANEEIGQLRVIDLSGQALKEIALSNNKVLNSLRIDVSAYNAGVYFVQLVTNKGEIETKKFLKQ